MTDLPEGDHIYNLYTGVYKPQVLRAALVLDVFSPLIPGAANAEAIARACHCDITGTRRLLDYLKRKDETRYQEITKKLKLRK